jgi:hypothetical protein
MTKKRYTVRLEPKHLDILDRFFDGCISKGIRESLENYAENNFNITQMKNDLKFLVKIIKKD